jgi:predicted phage-related endonuclease
MKIKKFQRKNKDGWLSARLGKISGTKAKNILTLRGNSIKKGFYELIYEKLVLAGKASLKTGEDPMKRGLKLESRAIKLFEKKAGKKTKKDLVIWISDENENLIVSPDAVISETEAVENKCLSPESHIEAYLTGKIPSEYEFQALQYFIINENLQKLYFCFYDPRFKIEKLQFFYIEILRSSLLDDIIKYKAEQIKVISEVENIVEQLISGDVFKNKKGVWLDV